MAEATNSVSASDVPLPKLDRAPERGATNLEARSQVTRDLTEARDGVQSSPLGLHKDRRLGAKLAGQDSVQQLRARIQVLEQEKRELEAEVARRPKPIVTDPPGLEAELANFANLHVAANRLHGTLSPCGVNRRIQEVLEQLIGVEAYIIYVSGPHGLQPIRAEGLRPAESSAQTPTERLAEVVASGICSIIHSADPSLGCAEAPPVLLPLTIDNHVVGVLSLVRFLSHKHTLHTGDFDLFKLVGKHAAAALMAAGLYANAGQIFPTADAFDALKH